jgi:hypothetical protein
LVDYPVRSRLIDAFAYFAQATREAGVGAFVNTSQISARREAKSHAVLCRDGQASDVLYTPFCLIVKFVQPAFHLSAAVFCQMKLGSPFQKLAQDQSPHPKRKEARGSLASKPKAGVHVESKSVRRQPVRNNREGEKPVREALQAQSRDCGAFRL